MTLFLSSTAAGLLLLNFPIFVCLLASAMLVIGHSELYQMPIVAQTIFGSLDKFALMAVPFFIFAANVMDQGGLSRRLVNLVQLVFAPVRGAVGLTTVGSAQLFGAISGSSPATVVAVGSILYPALIRSGYGTRFSVGLITCSGCLGILIPPSITMIIFATITNVSVGALFMAGVGAGLAFGAVLMAYVVVYAWRAGIAPERAARLPEILAAGRDAIWGLGAPILIVGGIYLGVFTPTEAAGVVAAYAVFVVTCVYKELKLPQLLRIAADSAVLTAQIMIVVAASGIFAWLLTVSQVPQTVSSSIAGFSPVTVLILINVLLLVAGMFLDPNSAQVILVPILFPIATAIGVDPVHFGMIVTTNLAIGMFTPPFGLNLFVATGLFRVSFRECVLSVLPFIALGLVALLLITWVPWISLVVPRLAGYAG